MGSKRMPSHLSRTAATCGQVKESSLMEVSMESVLFDVVAFYCHSRKGELVLLF